MNVSTTGFDTTTTTDELYICISMEIAIDNYRFISSDSRKIPKAQYMQQLTHIQHVSS